MAKPPSCWVPRTLVALTVLVCLGAGGYAAQMWRAQRVADLWMREPEEAEDAWGMQTSWKKSPPVDYFEKGLHEEFLDAWEACPWWGQKGWIPRETYGEFARGITGQAIGNDPQAWRAWFDAHPGGWYVAELRRLVDDPTLESLLKHPDKTVRKEALELMGEGYRETEKDVSGSIPSVAALLEDPDPEIRHRALRCLSHWGVEACEKAYFSDAPPEEQVKAAQAWWREQTAGRKP